MSFYALRIVTGRETTNNSVGIFDLTSFYECVYIWISIDHRSIVNVVGHDTLTLQMISRISWWKQPSNHCRQPPPHRSKAHLRQFGGMEWKLRSLLNAGDMASVHWLQLIVLLLLCIVLNNSWSFWVQTITRA